jgi:hypothetical protein
METLRVSEMAVYLKHTLQMSSWECFTEWSDGGGGHNCLQKKKIKGFQSKIVTLIVDVLTSKEDHMHASY